jgi:hypothetical protein
MVRCRHVDDASAPAPHATVPPSVTTPSFNGAAVVPSVVATSATAASGATVDAP